MSSDGSSGITQFGLYRTIDARTEEFLRLSRKRQIRQGCACAAISTAITVTVVVSVLLVYEYNIISGSNKYKNYVTPNWLGFINDSADTTPFDAKYSKTKLNLDKTTIKLLPILLKTLKQNTFFEKVIEEYTSTSPNYEPRDTTEQNYKKIFFSDPRSWFKAPTSKLYAIEFKTTPVVYYQPTRNLEYYTKIRKVRDYKRILNYLEKMINDKVSFTSNLNMMKRELQKENPSELSTTPIENLYKSKQKHRVQSFNKTVRRPPTIENRNCKCPIKLGMLLNKLLSNIDQLLPYSKIAPTLCNIRKTTKLITFPPKVTKNDLTTKFSTLKPVNVIPTSNYIENMKITTENIHLPRRGDTTKTTIEKNNNTNLSPENNIIKNVNIEMGTTDNHMDEYEKQTTVKNYLEATQSQNIQPQSTKLMTFATDKFANLIYQIFKNYFTPSKPTVATNKMENRPIFSNEEYDDYFISTQRTDTHYNSVDIHNLELVKTRMISLNKKAKNLRNKNEINTENETSSYIKAPNLVPIKKYKQKDLSFENKINSILLQKLINTKPKVMIQKDRTNTPKIEKSSEIYKSNNIVHGDNPFGYDDKILEDEFFEEYNIQKSSKTKDNPNNKTESTFETKDIVKLDKINEHVRSNENIPKKINSLLPQAKPVYLEINRNDRKQDDTHDYEFNLHNNLYDFPNI